MGTTKTNILKTEPSLILGATTAFLTEAFGLAIAFGIDVSDGQQKSIISTVTAAAALILILSTVIRQMVFSPASTEKLVNSATAKESAGETPPVLPL